MTKSALTAVPSTRTLNEVGNHICALMHTDTSYFRMATIERNWPNDDTVKHLMKMDQTLEQAKLVESPVDIFFESLPEPEEPFYPFRRSSLFRFVDFQLNSTMLSVTIRNDQSDVTIVTVDVDKSTSPFDSLIPSIRLRSSRLDFLLGPDGIIPEPLSTIVDNQVVKATFSKGDDYSLVISIKADKRMSIVDLSSSLASHLQLDPCDTVIWRDYGGHCEEQLRSNNSLEFISTSSRLSLRNGHVLGENQYMLNIYELDSEHLDKNKPKPPHFKRFSIVAEENWTVRNVKQMIAAFLKEKHPEIDFCIGSADPSKLPVEKCCLLCGTDWPKYHLRLRRNRYGEPSRILPDEEVLGKDNEWNTLKDLFLDFLTGNLFFFFFPLPLLVTFVPIFQMAWS